MAVNAVKAYFVRNWNREDMTNLDEITRDDVHTTLVLVYFTLFCASLCFACGVMSQPVTILPTVLSYPALLISLYFIPPQRVMLRFVVLMLGAYSFGGISGYVTITRFNIEKFWVYNFLTMTMISIGSVLFGAIKTRQRKVLYQGVMDSASSLLFSSLGYVLSNTSPWMIIGLTVHTLFLGYLVLYSQEILYKASFQNVNFVNSTFTVFFNFPGIVIHASRLYMQRVTNRI